MPSVPFTIFRPNPEPDQPAVEICGEVSGLIQCPEPDVGIMGLWVEDLCFTSDTGEPYELTLAEELKAEEALCEAALDDIDD